LPTSSSTTVYFSAQNLAQQRANSSDGRATALQAVGHGFDPHLVHQIICRTINEKCVCGNRRQSILSLREPLNAYKAREWQYSYGKIAETERKQAELEAAAKYRTELEAKKKQRRKDMRRLENDFRRRNKTT
jgi:hypothetical protein